MAFNTTFRGRNYTFETKAGLFSADKLDKGSIFLLENIDIKNGDRVIDLGCGYGALGLIVAGLNPNGKVFMVDIDIRAINYSMINSKINNIHNVEILPSDGFENIPPNQNFNVVLSNPPTHVPKETIIDFIVGAKKHLTKGGKLYFVTEKRIVPMIKREFIRVFGNYELVKLNSNYTISLAYQN